MKNTRCISLSFSLHLFFSSKHKNDLHSTATLLCHILFYSFFWSSELFCEIIQSLIDLDEIQKLQDSLVARFRSIVQTSQPNAISSGISRGIRGPSSLPDASTRYWNDLSTELDEKTALFSRIWWENSIMLTP